MYFGGGHRTGMFMYQNNGGHQVYIRKLESANQKLIEDPILNDIILPIDEQPFEVNINRFKISGSDC